MSQSIEKLRQGRRITEAGTQLSLALFQATDELEKSMGWHPRSERAPKISGRRWYCSVVFIRAVYRAGRAYLDAVGSQAAATKPQKETEELGRGLARANVERILRGVRGEVDADKALRRLREEAPVALRGQALTAYLRGLATVLEKLKDSKEH